MKKSFFYFHDLYCLDLGDMEKISNLFIQKQVQKWRRESVKETNSKGPNTNT